jgi:hypothetical protein
MRENSNSLNLLESVKFEIGVLSYPQFREQQLVVFDVVNWEKSMNATFLALLSDGLGSSAAECALQTFFITTWDESLSQVN